MRRIAAAVIVALIAVGALVAYRAHAPLRPSALHLADGTEVFFLSDTRVEPAGTYPRPREIRVNGDAFLRVTAGAAPLIVRTRLLVLTVSGGSALRVTAYWKQAGEQVEVLAGNVQARKSYPSTYSTPDQLTGGEMSMVNQTIDLMEKERFDPAPLRKWSDELIAATRRATRPP
jgi:ferric-dicitrate binding protein FerR (iron transport regulator)